MNSSRKPSARHKLNALGLQPYLLIKRRLSINFNERRLDEKRKSLSWEVRTSARSRQDRDEETRPAKTTSNRFKRLLKIVLACLRWCRWAQHTYRISIHRFISFAHINDSFKLHDDLHFEFLQLVSTQKRLAHTQSSESPAGGVKFNDLVESGRVRAEMMNFDVNYFKLV